MKSELKHLQVFKLYAFSILAVLSFLLSLFSISIIMAKSKSTVPIYDTLTEITAPIDTLDLVNIQTIGPMALFRLEGDSANYRISGMPYTLLDSVSFKNLQIGDTLKAYYRIQETKKGMMFKDLVYWLNYRDVWELKHNSKTLLSYNLSKSKVDLFNQQFLKWMYPFFAILVLLSFFFGFLTFRILRSK